jgi:hypothetical protein
MSPPPITLDNPGDQCSAIGCLQAELKRVLPSVASHSAGWRASKAMRRVSAGPADCPTRHGDLAGMVYQIG